MPQLWDGISMTRFGSARKEKAVTKVNIFAAADPAGTRVGKIPPRHNYASPSAGRPSLSGRADPTMERARSGRIASRLAVPPPLCCGAFVEAPPAWLDVKSAFRVIRASFKFWRECAKRGEVGIGIALNS